MTITALAQGEGHDRNNCEVCQSAKTGVEVIKHLENLMAANIHDSLCPQNIEGFHKFVDTPDGRKCYNCGEPMDLTESQDMIINVCDEIKNMLIEKNRKYGNSALNPVRIFSRSDELEQINVRVDDKLNRKKNQQDDEDEDIDMDLMGYLILKRVLLKMRNII